MEHGEQREVTVDAGEVALSGYLSVPDDARGLVIFAHGSGSSRDSPRNQHVADRLGVAGFATLLFDLLTDSEAAERGNVFDIPLLSGRLAAAIRWSGGVVDALPVGLFGDSTGAAAALTAAVELADVVQAVVSRGGRPDLCERLTDVRVPTLLVVGGEDHAVIEMNQRAAAQLTVEQQVAIVPGATHLFEEPGTLDQAAELAERWFARHLG